MHHGHFDGAAISQGEGQVLGVCELELFLPDAPEGHGVDEGHLQTLAPPPGGVSLGLPGARGLAAAPAGLEKPRLIWGKKKNKTRISTHLVERLNSGVLF